MTWRTVLVRGALDGFLAGLLVGGCVALALGMWIFGSLLLATTIFVLQLGAKARGA